MKQLPSLKKFKPRDSINLFYISLALCLLGVASLVSAVIVQHNTTDYVAVAAPQTGYSIDKPITMGLATTQVSKVSFSDGQPGFSVPAGKHYVIIDFSVRNNADHPINVFPSSDTYVKDTSGQVSYLAPFALEKPFHAGSLLPGEQIRGQLSFVGSKSGALKFYIESIWSGGVVSYKVQ